jgi:hypothetical protein
VNIQWAWQVRELDGLKREGGKKGADARAGVRFVNEALEGAGRWLRPQHPEQSLHPPPPHGPPAGTRYGCSTCTWYSHHLHLVGLRPLEG